MALYLVLFQAKPDQWVHVRNPNPNDDPSILETVNTWWGEDIVEAQRNAAVVNGSAGHYAAFPMANVDSEEITLQWGADATAFGFES